MIFSFSQFCHKECYRLCADPQLSWVKSAMKADAAGTSVLTCFITEDSILLPVIFCFHYCDIMTNDCMLSV